MSKKLFTAENIGSKSYLFVSFGLSVMGLMIWLATTIFAHRRDAWDSKYYFFIGLQILLIINFLFGFLKPVKAFLFGFAVICLQPIAMIIQNGIESRFLLSIILFILLGLLLSFSSFMGSFLKKLIDEEKK